jgi:hypothetical protein
MIEKLDLELEIEADDRLEGIEVIDAVLVRLMQEVGRGRAYKRCRRSHTPLIGLSRCCSVCPDQAMIALYERILFANKTRFLQSQTITREISSLQLLPFRLPALHLNHSALSMKMVNVCARNHLCRVLALWWRRGKV